MRLIYSLADLDFRRDIRKKKWANVDENTERRYHSLWSNLLNKWPMDDGQFHSQSQGLVDLLKCSLSYKGQCTSLLKHKAQEIETCFWFQIYMAFHPFALERYIALPYSPILNAFTWWHHLHFFPHSGLPGLPQGCMGPGMTHIFI